MIYSERVSNGDRHVYCDTHAYWRRKTIRLPLVWRMRPGQPPSASRNHTETR